MSLIINGMSFVRILGYESARSHLFSFIFDATYPLLLRVDDVMKIFGVSAYSLCGASVVQPYALVVER